MNGVTLNHPFSQPPSLRLLATASQLKLPFCWLKAFEYESGKELRPVGGNRTHNLRINMRAYKIQHYPCLCYQQDQDFRISQTLFVF